MALDAVLQERQRAQEKWGNDFDDKSTINDWVAYITVYLGEAVSYKNEDPEKIPDSLVKIAGLAVAALETYWRNNDSMAPRHYDDGAGGE
jgi:hypothetical protein